MLRRAFISLLFVAVAQGAVAQTFIGDTTPIFGRNSTTGQIGLRIGPNTFQPIGTLDPSTQAWRPLLQPPTTSIIGGVLAKAAVANRFLTGLGTDAAFTAAQPLFTDIGGQIAAGQVPSGLSIDSPNLTGTPKTPGFTGYLYANGGTGWTASATIPASALGGTIDCAREPIQTGDVSSPVGSCVFTLATVNAAPGPFGSSTSIPSFTVNAKGLVTVASGNPVVAPAGTLTGSTLAAGVTGSSLTSLGTVATGTWNATPIGAAYIAAGAAASNVGTLGGDLTGSLPNPILATVNTNVGSFGGASVVPSFTVNGKGLLTAAGSTAVVAPAGTLSGATLASNVINTSITSVGTIATGVWNGTAISAAYIAAGAAASNVGTLGGDLTGTLPSPTIAAGAVTNAKLAATMPTLTLKANISGGTASPTDPTFTAALDAAFGSTRGSVLVRGSTAWFVRTPNAAGQGLTFDGTDTGWASPGAAVTLFPGLLFGHTLANNAANPNTSLDIGAGTAASDDASVRMTLASALTKTMGAWASGGTSASPAGGLDVGSASANFWYHVFAIYNPTTLSTDALLSLSSGLVANQPSAPATISIGSPAVITVPNHGIPMYSAVVFSTTGALPTGITAGTIYYVGPSGYTANSFQITTTQNGTAVATSGTQSGTQTIVATPVMPSGYTKKRRVGSVKTTGTATNFTAFSQLGDEFLWFNVVQDVSMTSGFNTTAALYTVSSPPGVKTTVLFSTTTGSGNNVYAQSPDQSGSQGTAGAVTASGGTWAASALRTNTASQIQAYSQAANSSFYVTTRGWIDTRGK